MSLINAATYDLAVIGAGVFGAWTAYHLQQSGLKVALLDAYGPANNRASSGGESRIIRLGYGADEIYTRWAHRSLGRWQELFARTGRLELFQPTGVLRLAHEGDVYEAATRQTLRRLGLNFAELNRAELEQRYPQFDFGDVAWGLYEPDSGALLARRAVALVVEEFRKTGGAFLHEAVLPPANTGTLDKITTENGAHISAGTFIFACGPWLPKLFPSLLTGRISATRQEVFFFGAPAGDTRFTAPRMPTWVDFTAGFYGLPDLENRGFKVALDTHGAEIDPDAAERTASPEILAQVRAFLAQRFPALREAPLLESRVCQYENTSDGNFLIDRHPNWENVWLVGGGSGHGFKHGPALAEYVAALVNNSCNIEACFSLATKATFRRRTVF
jgi:monomeric sarcosine oxidase